MEVQGQAVFTKRQDGELVWQTQLSQDEAELAFRVYKMLDGNEEFSNVSEFHVVPVQDEDGSIISIQVTGVQREDSEDSKTQHVFEALQPQPDQPCPEQTVIPVDLAEDQYHQPEDQQITNEDCDNQQISSAEPLALSEVEPSDSQPPVTTMDSGARTLYQCGNCVFRSFNLTALKRHMRRHSDKHKCKMCEKTFGSKTELRLHVNYHLGIRPHKCKDCDMAYGTAADLLRHVRSVHTLEKPFQCCYCDYASVEANRMKVHIRSHTGERPYVCDQCPFATTDTFKLRRHLKTHTGEKPYTCYICEAKFTQNTSMKMHILRKHTDNVPKEHCPICKAALFGKNDVQVHIRKQHTYLETPLKCRFCPETFHERYILRQHQQIHKIVKQSALNSGRQRARRKNTETNMDGQYSVTNEDGYTWNFLPANGEARLFVNLDGHDQTGTVIELHSVPLQTENGSIFQAMVVQSEKEVDATALHTQVYEVQDLEQVLQPLVEQSFEPIALTVDHSFEQLTQNVEEQNINTECVLQETNTFPPQVTPRKGKRIQVVRPEEQIEVKLHRCKECDEAFATGIELLKHKKSHRPETSFKCPFCEHESIEALELISHIQLHSDDRPFRCGQCSFATTDAFKLNRHMRTHTGEKPFSCSVCQARFTQKTSMEMHVLRKHTKELPKLHCPTCDTVLTGKHSLNIHIRKQHMQSEKELKCRFCSAIFHERFVLRQHQKTHRVEKRLTAPVGVKRKRAIRPASTKKRKLESLHLQDHELVAAAQEEFTWQVLPTEQNTEIHLLFGEQEDADTVTEYHVLPVQTEDGSIISFQLTGLEGVEQLDAGTVHAQVYLGADA